MTPGTPDTPDTPEQGVAALAQAVRPVDGEAAAEARRRSDGLLKPPGSLGALEDLGARLAAIAGRCPPPVPADPAVVVAAADHGVAAGRRVTAWPQSVTAAMTGAFCAGNATVNAIARAVGARVGVLDVGVAGEVPDSPPLRRARVRNGTADLTAGPAMSREQAARALLAGAALAGELVRDGVDLLVAGDMGIGNTTAGACLVAAFTGTPAELVVGRGAGADDAALASKTAVVGAALARARPDPSDPLGVMSEVGGLELAALAGLLLAGAAEGLPVVLDGLASDAAALTAVALQPAVAGYLIAGHRSTEPGATIALKALGLEPLLDLGMRLGEGTGGLLAVPLVTAAARVLSEVGSLADL
jgi:nicotinate-nucleotide--dimethylbenzimidazole phosphoribosyltransferase